MKKRILCLLLALTMCLSMMPVSAFAAESADVEQTVSKTETATEEAADETPADPVLYKVTAEGATAEPAQAAEGTKVMLTVVAPEGQVFDKWETTDGVEIIDGSFAMPAQDVQVKALFKAAEPEKVQEKDEKQSVTSSAPLMTSNGAAYIVEKTSKVWTTGTWVANSDINRIWVGDHESQGFARVEVQGDVTLVLNANLTVPEGIHVGEGNSLTIRGNGTLVAGPKIYSGEVMQSSEAGIGGNPNENAGTIKIEGGNVTAYGNAGGGSGIGGGGFLVDVIDQTQSNPNAGDGGNIIITGGNVTAVGRFGAAGIGGGATTEKGVPGSGGNISISGGIIHAISCDGGAAIGSGICGAEPGKSGIIRISGPADVTVDARNNKGAGIGCGLGGTVENIEIDGATINGTGYAGIGAGVKGTGGTITIKNNASVNASVKNGTGSLTIQNSAVVNDGIESGTVSIENSKVDTGSAAINASESLTITNKSTVSAGSISNKTSQQTWDGIITENGNITVLGNQTLSENLSVMEGKKLTIPRGSSLKVPAGITLTNNEKIENQGTIQIEGTLDNYGDVSGSGTVDGTIADKSQYTITTEGNCKDAMTFVSGVAANNRIFPNRDVVFKVNKKNYEVDVSYTVSGGQPQFMTEQNGTYTIPKNQINGNVTLTIDNRKFTTVTSDVTTWTPGVWKVPANSTVTIPTTVTVQGNVTLMLEEGCNLIANDCIYVSAGNSLTIQGTGKLTAKKTTYDNEKSTPIGAQGEGAIKAGTIIINSGTIEANANKEWYSAIGGVGATVTINGGKVNAIGGSNAHGIYGNEVVINGGTVTATGGNNGAGISGLNISVHGGEVTATGQGDSAAIGSRSGEITENITITGGKITANGNVKESAGIGSYNTDGGSIVISGGEVTATGKVGIGSGRSYGGNIVISGGKVTATGEVGGIGSGKLDQNCNFSTGDNGNAVIRAKSIADQSKKDQWSGIISEDEGTTYTVYGNTTLTGNFELPQGSTMNIPDSAKLTIAKDKTLTNNGKIDLQPGGTLDLSQGGALAGGYTDNGGNYIPPAIAQDALTLNAEAAMTYGEKQTLSVIGGSSNGAVTYNVTSSDGGAASINGNVLTADHVGTIQVTATMAGNVTYLEITSAPVTITIEKAESSVKKAPAASANLTYTGAAQSLVTEGTATGGEILYSLTKTGGYKTEIPTGTKAGAYNVWYKVVGDENHNDSVEDYVTAKIAKAKIDVSGWQWDYAAAIPYTGNAEKVVLQNQNTNTGLDLVDIRYTDNEKTNAGSYTATAAATVKDAANREITGSIPNCRWEISRALISNAAVSVTAPQAGAIPQTKIQDSGNHWSASISWAPSVIDSFGYNTAYTATVTLTPDGNHRFDGNTAESTTLTNAKLNNNGTITGTKIFAATRKAKIQSVTAPQDRTLTVYCATEQDAINVLPKTAVITAEDGTTSLDLSWEVVGTYNPATKQTNTFKWTANAGNLDKHTQTLTGIIIVTNVDAQPVINIGAAREIIYDGNAFDVAQMFTLDHHAGAASYTIDSTSTGAGILKGSILTITKAGTITIKVTTAANDPYASGEATATLTVNKAAGTGSVTLAGWTYGEALKTPNPASSTNGTASVTYTYAVKETENFEAKVPQNAGNYTVKATFAATDLYKACTATADFTIAQKTLAVTANNQEITYAEHPVIQTGTAQVTVTELKAGDTLTGITLTANSDYSNVLASGAVITNRDADATSNYSITYNPGILTRVHDWNDPTYSWEQKSGSWTCTAERTDKNNAAVKETTAADVNGVQSKAPTCTEKGNTTYTARFTEDWATEQIKVVTDIAATGHSWGETTYLWSEDGSSCTAKRVCKTDETHIEETAATITSKQSKAPTCEGKGETTYTATFTEKWAETQTETLADVAAIGHKWNEPVFIFSEDGKTARAMVTCQNDKTHTKAVAGVTVTGEITTAATCSEKGTTTYTAKATFEGQEYTGTTTRQDVAFDPANHNNQIVKVDAKAPTCTADGNKEHFKCEGCGKLYRDADASAETTLEEITVAATGHSWGEPVITFAQDGKTATAVVTCQNDMTHTQTLPADITSQVKEAPTKETMGITTYTAIIYFEGKTYTATKNVQDIPKVKPAETVEKVETQELAEVPEGLEDTPYNTIEKIEKAMEEVVLQQIREQNAGNEQKTIIYDAMLTITENGVTRPATKEEVEARGGITVVIPYPAGTNKTDFIFTVAHMLTIDMAGMRAGDIETPEITLTDAGLKVTLKGLSPVMVGYGKKAAEPAPTEPIKPNPPKETDTPQTGDESNMMLWLLLGLASACGLTGTILFKRKRSSVK